MPVTKTDLAAVGTVIHRPTNARKPRPRGLDKSPGDQWVEESKVYVVDTRESGILGCTSGSISEAFPVSWIS